MSNLDDSIGKLLLDLQKDDPEIFHKLMKKAREESPELFEGPKVIFLLNHLDYSCHYYYLIGYFY